MKLTYPEDYSDEEKAMYDDMISRGQALLGKKLSHKDEFLLDLSAKITINNMRPDGVKNTPTQEEVSVMMGAHLSAQQTTIVETPENMYEEGDHPLQRPETRITNEPPEKLEE